MGNNSHHEPMLELFIFETGQLLTQLEELVLSSEKRNGFGTSIDEIFRIMHTIKGSAAMMLFNNISALAHSIEDLFYFLREDKPSNIDYQKISDLVFSGIDFIKNEMVKIESSLEADGNADALIGLNKECLADLKNINSTKSKGNSEKKKNGNPPDAEQKFYIGINHVETVNDAACYKALVFFEEGCKMENTRAFMLAHQLKEYASEIRFLPPDIVDNDDSAEIIQNQGFCIFFKSQRSFDDLKLFFDKTPFMKSLELNPISLAEYTPFIPHPKPEINLEDPLPENPSVETESIVGKELAQNTTKQTMISVHVERLDKLMDLVGELVISEAMVTRNPDLEGLGLENFQKSARQLQKITTELQDTVMSIRMVPLTATFQKMNRLVRDMSRKLKRTVELEMSGQDTEVDKNIIDHLSDPLLHIIRNCIDHGIESAEERKSKAKPDAGKIVLEAKNAGSEVWIIVKDDGRGLDREKILNKARQAGLITKAEDKLTDREVFSFIMLPGFSTKEKVTEFSGRGVGMDVVCKNIEKVGGSVIVDSVNGAGTTIWLKIPLTLAIVDGMSIRVANSFFTIPTQSIKESFRLPQENVITDPDGNEMVMVRNQCYPIIRLYQLYKIKDAISEIGQGIIVMIENDNRMICLFADELLGEQQVVVKSLPSYLKKVKGITGCTLLSDGGISLILDTIALVNL